MIGITTQVRPDSPDGGGSQGGNAANGGPQGGNSTSEKLNSTNDDLVQWVTKSCTAVPSNLWQTTTTSNGGRAGGMQLYDCASVKSVVCTD